MRLKLYLFTSPKEQLVQKISTHPTTDDIYEVYEYDARGLMDYAAKGVNEPPTDISVCQLNLYDGLGYVTQVEQNIQGGASIFNIDYERDQLGRVTKMIYPHTSEQNCLTLSYTHTSLGKVDTITDSTGGTDLLASYDYAGSFVRQRLYDNPSVTHTPTYDSFGRVSTLATVRNASNLVKFTYSYDQNSNIISQKYDHRASTPYNLYTYDDLDRLTKSDYLVGVLTQDEQFTYDDLGNRLTLNNRAGNDVAYAHNVANEYTSIGGTNVSHDAAGNLSADDNGYTYEYDHDNRLTKIKKNSGATTVAAFTYDALGRRIEAIDSIATTTTRYYYDGWRVLSETNSAGTHQRHYVYGNYLDEALLLIHDDGTATPTYTDYYYAHNHLYSPVALIEDDGTVVERYEYDAYGKCYVMDVSYNSRSSSSYNNVIAFTGQRLDSLDDGDLQLMYYKNRFYCTNTGRFLQRDPIEYEDGLNLYEYVRSNPIMFSDVYGLQAPVSYYSFYSIPKKGGVCCKQRSRVQCCNDIKSKGWDYDHYGGVICCDGRKLTCVWNIPKGGNDPGEFFAWGAIRECVLLHELTHPDDVPDCPQKCPHLSRQLKPKEGIDYHAEECDAYKTEYNCLKKIRDKWCNYVLSPQSCRRIINRRLAFIRIQIRTHCIIWGK